MKISTILYYIFYPISYWLNSPYYYIRNDKLYDRHNNLVKEYDGNEQDFGQWKPYKGAQE